MIRCSTLHDLQCLCHQKCCTILIFQFQFVISRTDCGKAVTVPYSCSRNSAKNKCEAIGGIGPNIIFASQRNRVRLGGCIKLHLMAELIFFFVRDAVSSLTRAFLLHKIHIYWNKRKGSHKENRSGPLFEISASRTEISLSAHHFT